MYADFKNGHKKQQPGINWNQISDFGWGKCKVDIWLKFWNEGEQSW